MALFKIIGKANYDGCCQKKFEVVVESNDSNFEAYSDRKQAAIKKIHPDWEAINVETWNKLS